MTSMRLRAQAVANKEGRPRVLYVHDRPSRSETGKRPYSSDGRVEITYEDGKTWYIGGPYYWYIAHADAQAARIIGVEESE